METPHINSPAVLTGCISKLSVVERHGHAYFDALKDYAAHYAEAQAYLAVDDARIAHDYTSIGKLLSESDHGLLGDDGEPVIAAQISDEDINTCGYLAWLRH